MELKTYFAQDRNGSLIPAATVAIYLTGTNTLASGLTNVSNAPLSNPFTADADGKIQFHAPDGIYDMQVSQGSTTGVRVTFQCVDVEQQLSDANSAADRAEAAADSIEGQAASISANTREQWRRTLADAGLNLVSGSFETGATASTETDAVWHVEGGQCYTWGGTLPKTVPENSTPESSGGISPGAWVDVRASTFKKTLSMPGGQSLVGAYPQGTLAHLQRHVTPEQFGAIGDGTVHPLSERYATLAEAQAVYPHVTSLTQTIDWAACQAAENYARGVTKVIGNEFSEYHFGHDGLMISQYSRWQGGMTVSQGLRNCALKKTFPTSTPVFQQDYIVRVSPEQNDNPFGTYYYKDGISFEGFRLYYDVPRRHPTKGTRTICFHFGDMVKSKIDVAVWGAEYGVYTWVAWGNRGRVSYDNCHKGFFSVPHLGDNERAGSGTITSNNFIFEFDVVPFPITVGKDSYSHYTGYFEGSLSTDGNYDSANETACGITIIDGCTGTTFNMGIEKWQGVHVTKVGAESAQVSFRFGWFTDDHYKMSTGNDGADASLRAITGTSAQRIQLPAAQRSYLNVLSGAGPCNFTFHDTAWYMGNVFSENTSTRYLVNIQNTSSFYTFVGGSAGFTPEAGAAPVSFSVNETMKSLVEVIGCRNMDTWCAPSTSWRLVGRNRWRQIGQTNVVGTLVNSVGYYADFIPPSGYVVAAVDRLTVNLGINTAAAIQNAPGLIAYEPVNGSGMPAGAVRAATSYSGGSAPTFNAVLEITR